MQFFSIGQLSSQTDVKVSTIRYYEAQALIAPSHRTEGNQRRFTDQDLIRLRFIKHARQLGFGIEAIKQLLNLQTTQNADAHRAEHIAKMQLIETRNKINQLQRLEAELERMCQCDGEESCDVLTTLGDHGQCQHEH